MSDACMNIEWSYFEMIFDPNEYIIAKHIIPLKEQWFMLSQILAYQRLQRTLSEVYCFS